MTATAPRTNTPDSPDGGSRIRCEISAIDSTLAEAQSRQFDADFFDALGAQLRRLHACVRVHHAAGELNTAHAAVAVPPELTPEVERLRREHSTIIGQLDRLIRCVDAMVDRDLEDKEVFFLRATELLSILRRHIAEEDRLFYLAMWHDTGGES